MVQGVRSGLASLCLRVCANGVTEGEEVDRVSRGSPPRTCGDDDLVARG